MAVGEASETVPAHVTGVDTSENFLDHARARIADPRAAFQVGDSGSLPLPDHRVNAVVSGLTLKFVPDPHRAAAEFARVATSGGVAAAYVWNYADVWA